jgi:2-amino-4-hydroxy-6-hydroxymethyldihydropteridine diphosphokinase
MEHIVYLALGSNLGVRSVNLKNAINNLTPQMNVKAKSHVYETAPWGFADQPALLNQVVKAETYLEPEALLQHLKRLESVMGRVPSFQNGPRLIDIDILFFDDLVLNSPIVQIQHPRLHERAFVLMPMNDLAPELVHPILQKSIGELLLSSDLTKVNRV